MKNVLNFGRRWICLLSLTAVSLLMLEITATAQAADAAPVPATKQAPTNNNGDAFPNPATPSEIDLLDGPRLQPVLSHACGAQGYTNGPSCGTGTGNVPFCCEKGEVCLSGKYNADSEGVGQFCCPEGMKWCPGGHGISGGCLRPPKVCTGESPHTAQ
jgi:hypothetical protein